MPTPEKVLLDTHALLWWKAGRARLSAAAAVALDSATSILISPISCWEVGMLVVKGRVKLDRPTRTWVDDVLAPATTGLAELTAATAVAAAELADFHGDPADRIIVASAQTLGIPLITKDRLIHSYARGRPGLQLIW
jgi:PIN domain nuclease of toxin-antitoxin system